MTTKTEPLSVREILAAADSTASFRIVWPGSFFRRFAEQVIHPISVREYLSLCERHQKLVALLDQSHRAGVDLASTLPFGREGMVAMAAASMRKPVSFFKKAPDELVLYAFMNVCEVSIPSRQMNEFFVKELHRKDSKPAMVKTEAALAKEAEAQAITAASTVAALAQHATEYTIRTGTDGMALSPLALLYARHLVAHADRTQRYFMELAITSALGSKEARTKSGELI